MGCFYRMATSDFMTFAHKEDSFVGYGDTSVTLDLYHSLTINCKNSFRNEICEYTSRKSLIPYSYQEAS